VLVPVCAQLPFYLDRAVNQLIEKHATVQRIIIVEWKCMCIYIYIHSNTFGKRHGCTYAVCPSIWVKQQKETNIILKSGIFPFKAMLCRKMMVRLNFIKVVLYLFTYINIYIFCFCKNIAFSFQELSCLQGNSFEEMKPLRYKQMPWWKREWGLTSLKDVLHFSTHYSFLARILLPI